MITQLKKRKKNKKGDEKFFQSKGKRGGEMVRQCRELMAWKIMREEKINRKKKLNNDDNFQFTIVT